MKFHKKIYGDLIQLIGVIMLGAGVICEIIYKADVFYVIITIGAIVFTIGTKVKGH